MAYHRPTYSVWWAMKARCTDPSRDSYCFYGGKGVTVCPRWFTYDNFVEDMGYRPDLEHTLDRIDPTGNYEPGNCRWETWDVQNNNKTTSRFITHDGQRLTHTQWSRKLGGNTELVRARVKRGWSLHEAVTVEPNGKRRSASNG